MYTPRPDADPSHMALASHQGLPHHRSTGILGTSTYLQSVNKHRERKKLGAVARKRSRERETFSFKGRLGFGCQVL